ncbi:armadillo-type protein [Coemansia mojavensis]|nr:armadillo-type protein [Coemansia mojavensis]
MSEHLRSDILARLRTRDADERAKAAQQLCNQVKDSEAIERHGEQNPLYVELNTRLVKLLNPASDMLDRLAATSILSALADIDTLEDKQKFRITQQTKNLLSGSDILISMEAVAIYKKLIEKHWAPIMSSVETEVNRSLEWLGSERNEVRRMTALRVIEVLCSSNLVSLYSYVPKIFTSLSNPLRDQRSDMRTTAASTLGACLGLVPMSERNVRNPWLNFLFEELQRDYQMNSVEGYHGALLIAQELLLHGGMYMQSHFGQVCEMALRLKDHRDSVVHKTSIALLPVLARYSPQEFTRVSAGSSESMLGRACNYLITLSRATDQTRDRAAAFVALGSISQFCSTEFRSFLEPTTRAIRDALMQRAKMRIASAEADETVAAVLQTIATLAAAMGPALTRYMRDILDLMFAAGLSQALCDSLLVLEREVSQLQPAIHGRLLDVVSIILVNVPFRLSNGREQQSDSTLLVTKAASSIPVTTDMLVLALRTLRMFDFSEENLSEFVRNAILQYLSHSSSAVRKEAIYAVSHIVMADPLYRSMAGAGVEVASEVVQRLVSTAVIDLDSDVRLTAVQMLEKGTNFDFHMGKAQNIQDLFLLLNDEVFAVRLTVLGVIGRLANMNPAHVMPSLRRMVVQLLTELEFARSNREREECIQLLMVLVRAAENWVRPYVGDIFRKILPRIDDAPAQLASKLLNTVAELARVGGSDLVDHLDQLLASIMHALGDTSNSAKRMSALKALNSCASFCGMVIEPYVEYPQLFSILAEILKSSQSDSEMRLEVMRTMGALGAIDPHRFKDAAGVTTFNSERPKAELIGDIPTHSYGTTFSGDAYYTLVSVNALLRILDDTSEIMFHQEAAQALIFMFAPLQNACAPYLDRVVPALLRAMDVAPPSGRDFYILTLGRLVGIARQLIRPFLEPVFRLFSTETLGGERQQMASIGLIEVMAEALSGDFGPHIATVLPFLIAVIDRDSSEQHQTTLRALPALQILSPSLEGYLFLVMPRLIALLDIATTPINVVEAALKCISSVVAAVNCSSFASRIVLTLVRLLQCSPTPALQTAAIDVLCTLMEQLQDEFTVFMPTIDAAMKKRGITDHAQYERYSRLLFSGRLVPKEPPRVQPQMQGDAAQAVSAPALGQSSDGLAKQEVSVSQLRRAWSTKQQVSKDGWLRWLHGFTYELLQQSPAPALRACSNLANRHPRLSKDLFNAAFVSCWTVLPGQYQQEIIASLQGVAAHADVPPDILQTILGLAGYMERDEKQIPIDLKRLGDYADRCHALAKELHYKEAEWTLEKNYETIEKLIELNQNLDLHDSAVGMLDYVRKDQPDVQESVEWYLRLQQWDKALVIFRRQEAERGPSYENTKGQIRCLFEMSDWEALSPIYERIWNGNDQQLQMASANIGMSMAWAMGNIDRMEYYLATLPNKSRDKSFCRALLAVYRSNFDEAVRYINDAREEMESDLVSHITESYSRGYSQVFRCQMLTELEEVIAYKMSSDDRERQAAIVDTWRQRLGGIQQDVGMWQKLLRLRSMVLRPVLDLDTWIKYVNMSRKSGHMRIARDAIAQLLEDEVRFMEEPALVYMYLKYKWADNERREAFQMLEMFASDYASKIGFDVHNPEAFAEHIDARVLANISNADAADDARTIHLLARFYFKQAEWLSSVQQSFLYELRGERINEAILESYRAATVLDRKWYKAWHSLALRHYHVTQRFETEHGSITEEVVENHVVPAVHGFFRAIQLSKSDTTLQDTLRLLTAWFNYSQFESVAQAVQDGFNSISIRTWLQVIPQILARIHINSESTRRLIRQLLVEIGKNHPHAILFSLYVAARSDHTERSQAAKDVLAKLHDVYPELVEETEVVSRELIRITLLFPEMWQEALRTASLSYYGRKNVVEMMNILRPLHKKARTPETLREYHFVQMFGNDLAAAEELLNQFFSVDPAHRNDTLVQQAWELYYVVFRRIEKLFPKPSQLALKDTAPILLECRDMELAVPGTYDPDREIINIQSFDPIFVVYSSKQHPRRMEIRGSDGNSYTFLLKGREDLRQDERVMQLFGLINSLLMKDDETARRSLAIERFPVVPLSSNSGLIGFYPDCENINNIIRYYRESHGQPVNLEQRMALQFSPNWDTLTVMQKVESFEYALSNTPGNDLQRAMWYTAPNAEVWLERRTNYTRSLAVMSIAGYILGLGDRHPSNILIHEHTGKVVHIDLGDCFEMAAYRDKFPEKVPFRLTRMLIMPMEVGSIEGIFKHSANHTMRVLRANRDSLMAVLEAFVFDPLVSWSYLRDSEMGIKTTPKPQKSKHPKQKAQQEHASRWNTSNGEDFASVSGSKPDGEWSSKVGDTYHDLVDGKDWQTGNPKARAIVKRIYDKLIGTDFNPNEQLAVSEQIEKLIQQATSSENLAVLYVGWVPMW